MTHEDYMRQALALAREAQPPVPLVRLQGLQLRRFMGQIHGRGLSGRSIARTLSAWRGFYRWLGGRGLVSKNPVDGIRAPKSPKALPQVLSPDQAAQLLDAPQVAITQPLAMEVGRGHKAHAGQVLALQFFNAQGKYPGLELLGRQLLLQAAQAMRPERGALGL